MSNGPSLSWHSEAHRSQRSGWLRALVLGANDGIVSIAGLLAGVAAAAVSQGTVFLTGVAGLTAGALSMAAGEYVSVSSQSDALKADKETEASELEKHPEREREELVRIYELRGLDRPLAEQVADQLTEKNALEAHIRDEIGITDVAAPHPTQAALVSAGGFFAGAVPVIIAASAPPFEHRLWVLFIVAIFMLAFMGWLAARLGGARQVRGTVRVIVGGVLAMVVTAIIGHFVGGAV